MLKAIWRALFGSRKVKFVPKQPVNPVEHERNLRDLREKKSQQRVRELAAQLEEIRAKRGR